MARVVLQDRVCTSCVDPAMLAAEEEPKNGT